MAAEDPQFTGMDGKKVSLKHSKALTAKPWYAADGAHKCTSSVNYDAKRDAYKDYDPESYKTVLATFNKTSKKSRKSKKRPGKAAMDTVKGPIYDKYSRTNQTDSVRDRSDTAHYLRDLSVFGELEFNGPSSSAGDDFAHQLPRNGSTGSPKT